MTSSRTAKTIFNRSLSRSRQPVLLIDSERRIVFANPAAEALLGFSIEELSEVICQYHDFRPENPVEAAAAKVCPPPQVYAEGKECRTGFGTAGVVSADWMIRFCPLAMEDDERYVIAIFDQQPGPTDDPPGLSDQMRQIVRNATEFCERRYRIEQFVGQSEAAKQILVKANAAVASGANLVVFGPPGSGRQHLARTIYQISLDTPDSGEKRDPLEFPMLPMDGAIADPEMVQTTFKDLFDFHSMYGISECRLLLLNADRLPPAAQNELLGFLKLQNNQVRVSSTSQTSLTRTVANRTFDSELAAILSTVEIEIPPLAERIEDIPILAQMFLERGNQEGGNQFSGFTREALDCLIQYSWPGNADEMQQWIDEVRERTGGPLVGKDDLPKKIKLAIAAERFPEVQQETIDLDRFLLDIETEVIRRAMERSKGNKTRAAEILGINRARLIRRLESVSRAGEDADWAGDAP